MEDSNAVNNSKTPLLLLVALICGASILRAQAQPLPFDPTPVQAVQQDGEGRTWALADHLGLLFWADGNWQPAQVLLPAPDGGSFAATGRQSGALPLLLETNKQGDLHIVWTGPGPDEDGLNPCWITRRDGTNTPVSKAFKANLPVPVLRFGSDGTGWLTGSGPQIYRVLPDLEVREVYAVRSNQMCGSRRKPTDPVLDRTRHAPDRGSCGGTVDGHSRCDQSSRFLHRQTIRVLPHSALIS